MRSSALLLLCFVALGINANETDAARKRWAESPHGLLLERILPPGFEADMLPEPA